jgi:hypothetical protein
VSLSRDSQTYGRDRATELREERLDGQIGLSTWVNADVRAEINTGVDAWTRIDGSPHRTLWVGGVVERRLRGDRMSVQASAFQWIGMARAPGFGVVAVDAAYHSRRDSAPLVLIGRAGASTASSRAPLALWSGAGEGRSRAPLLRAHSLLDDGRIDGAVFGRTLVHATAEVQHWLSRPTLVRIGGAVFADTARAGGRPDFSAGGGFQLDVGAGLRVRVPGRSGVFRIDLAHGTRDGADAVLVGWALD